MHKALFTVVLIHLFCHLNAQELPKVVPPSPETSTLFKYQEYPVDVSTGLPEISIPLYEIRLGELSIPISISYHAAGRSVSDQDGAIAAGWSLNAGGMISRTIYGYPDFGVYPFPSPYKSANDISWPNDIAYLQNISHYSNSLTPGYFTDSEYDIFSCSVSGLTGKFIFKDNNGVKTATTIPYKPYKIVPTSTTAGLSRIEITDDKGMYYKFTGHEIPDVFGAGYTGYALTEIRTSDRSRTVTFNYTGKVQTKVSMSQSYVVDDDLYGGDTDWTTGFSELPSQVENKSTINYQVARLTEIIFEQGRVVFNVEATSQRVLSIDIYNANGKLKSIEFVRSALTTVSDGNPPISKLDAVVFRDSGGTEIERYSFTHYPFKYPFGSTAMDIHFADYWGYYNASGVQNMVPFNKVPFVQLDGQTVEINVGSSSANRSPNLDGLKSGVLKSIVLPTGGVVEFSYENNKYKSVRNNQIYSGPGLRVSQITTRDNFGNTEISVYKYGLDECGYSFIDMEPDVVNMTETIWQEYMACSTEGGLSFSPPGCGFWRTRSFLSDFNSSVSALVGRPIVYQEIVKYNGTPTRNEGKTLYQYDNFRWATSPMSNGGIHVGNFNYVDIPSLLVKQEYKANTNVTTGAITYTLIHQIENTYTTNTVEQVSGIHVKRLWNFPQSGTISYLGTSMPAETYGVMYHPGFFGIRSNPQVYQYASYVIPIGSKNLTNTTENLFTDNGQTYSNTISYGYNSNHYQYRTTQTTSEGKVKQTETKYPSDFAGNAIYDLMCTGTVNILKVPVQTKVSIDGAVVQTVTTNFANWGTSAAPRIAPQSVDIQTGSNPSETRLRYIAYNSFMSPLEVKKESDLSISYIWDYSNTLPIAEASNATNNQIAYSSFEGDGVGNWSGITSANIRSTYPGLTGRKYYDLTGAAISKSGLTFSDVYVLTYWTKSSVPCTVSGTAVDNYPKSLTSVVLDGVTWNLWEHRITGVSTISISGSHQIDELRLYPIGTVMRTFTYDPLIGMTTSCDANNLAAYFNYDNYGRLRTVKDWKGNILKMIDYKMLSPTP